MPTITINDFKSNIKDLARPNRFFVQFTGAGSTVAGFTDEMMFQVKVSSLPARSVGNVELNWFGMILNVSTDTSFEDFSITFLNDYEFKLRKCFETWLNFGFNLDNTELAKHDEYKAEIKVDQLGRDGEVIKTIRLIGAYPSNMDQIELSMDSNDTVEEFTVSFKYDYWTSD